jgi:hypothetical protein
MRQDGGRPSSGMRPRVTREDGSQIAPAITVLIVEKEPAATLDLLRHTVRKTPDPSKRYEDGLKILSSEYYRDSQVFSDIMTALFPAASPTAATLLSDGYCVLHFQEGKHSLRIACAIAELAENDPFYQLTYWHNLLFNPYPPYEIRMLAFYPDWTRSSAR